MENDVLEVIQEHKEAGTLPENLHRFSVDSIPSIRSCVTVPEGWVMVESDYKTAEIRALAYIAPDQNLIRLMNDPDTQFALVKVKDDLVPVRIGYDKDCGIPTENQYEKFINAIASNNEIVRYVDPSEFVRDEAGNLEHPAADLHWSLVEFMNKLPREMLDKKKHRDGVGKVGNFSCLPASTKVLTQFGEIPILDLNSDLHKLWDGVSWVSYEGIICKGKQEVFEYQGLRATADHGVWLEDGEEVYFGEAIINSSRLSQTMGENSEAILVNWKNKVYEQTTTGKSTEKEELIQKLVSLGYNFVVEEVYDLVNAGPNKRYTANGVLVSNTSYGATESTLERKIEADTGHKPEEGTGEGIFSALKARQPDAVNFLEEMQNVPALYPYITAASGRRRHFVGTNDKSMGFKERKSLLSSQGREARNFYMQESVGATAMRACIWLIKEYKRLGLEAKVMICLYDALVSICPLHERHIVAKLHQLYMTELNTWEYHGVMMNYPIDTEFVFRWSVPKLNKKEKEILERN